MKEKSKRRGQCRISENEEISGDEARRFLPLDFIRSSNNHGKRPRVLHDKRASADASSL